jgi:hypothetical protein
MPEKDRLTNSIAVPRMAANGAEKTAVAKPGWSDFHATADSFRPGCESRAKDCPKSSVIEAMGCLGRARLIVVMDGIAPAGA